ncbi:MAG: glycosyltransferase family 4 protein [Gaiellaceae bacterium]
MEYPPETGGGGIGSYVLVQAAALVARGHEVHVLSCVPGQESRDYVDGGVHVHRRGQRYLRGASRIARESAWRLHGALASFLAYRRLDERFDVIEAPDWAAEGFFFALFRPAPLVAHLHSPLVFIYRGSGRKMGWDDRFASLLERVAVRRADVVTAPSGFIVDELRGEGWLPRRDVQVIPHPIDLARWAIDSTETPPRILTVGRVEPRKSPEILVEGAARLLQQVPGLEIVFLGRSNYRRDGMPYRDWVAAMARASGVQSTFVDSVPRDELAAWYGRARVVVLPSAHDNLPMAGLEAMAAGRPLVCSSRTGLAELVENSRAGRTFTAGSVDELTDALRPFLVDPQLAEEAGRWARELVERRCSPERVTEERERCYDHAIRLFRKRG